MNHYNGGFSKYNYHCIATTFLCQHLGKFHCSWWNRQNTYYCKVYFYQYFCLHRPTCLYHHCIHLGHAYHCMWHYRVGWYLCIDLHICAVAHSRNFHRMVHPGQYRFVCISTVILCTLKFKTSIQPILDRYFRLEIEWMLVTLIIGNKGNKCNCGRIAVLSASTKFRDLLTLG